MNYRPEIIEVGRIGSTIDDKRGPWSKNQLSAAHISTDRDISCLPCVASCSLS